MEQRDTTRWTMLKDMLFFQFKLVLDAVRDLILSPAAFIAVLFDVFKGHHQQESYFYKLMSLGRQSDKWINLFGAGKEVPDQIEQPSEKTQEGVDQMLSKLELVLKEQHEKGGLTASAKLRIDSYLNKMLDKRDPKS